jgi:long-chain fatty acid transport protein
MVGVTVHSKTSLSDLETSNAKLSMNIEGPACQGAPSCTIELDGEIKVKDFEWPAMIGLGIAFQATNDLLIVADIKQIKWSDVMNDFNMVFTADSNQGDFSDAEIDAKLFQNWEDQHVAAIGMAYQFNPAFTGRVGYNRASNPIPDAYLNALFPAIVESHVTAGIGYAFTNVSSVDFALSRALERSATNPGTGIESAMSQTNWQLMYTHKY